MQEQTNETRGRQQGKVRYKKDEAQAQAQRPGCGAGQMVMRADGCARRRCSLGEEQGLEREGW